MLPIPLIESLARQLYEARKSRTALRQFSRTHPEMTIEDAYAVQREWVRLELADGRTIKGRKIGLTSRAMQQASQIDEPDFVPLMDDMFFEPQAPIPIDRFIAPRVEVEPTQTSRPLRRARMCGSAARLMRWVPSTLTSYCSASCAGVKASAGPNTMWPALCTITSRPQASCSTCRMAASTDSSRSSTA